MQHYDLRIIADCLVFSYEVEGPSRPAPKKQEISAPVCAASADGEVRRRSTRRQRKRAARREEVKRGLLRFLFFFLAPLVMMADLVLRATTLAVDVCRRRPAYITTLATVSLVTIVSAVIGLL